MIIRKSIFFYSILFASLVIVPPSLAQRDKKNKKQSDIKLSDARLREAEFFFTEGQKYFILEDYTKALLYFQRVVELNPENGTVHYKIAEVLIKSNKQEDLLKASISIESAIKFDKKNKYFYILASNIYSNLNNFEKAEKALESMMEEVDGTEEYLYELAALYQYDKKPNEAVKVYNSAESILGINEISSLQKQKIFLQQGKIEEAIAEGEKLLNTYPDEENYVLGFVETLSQNNQGARSITYLEKFIEGHPDAGSAKMLLAGLYRANGQEQKAREFINTVFEDPSVDVSSKILMLGTYTTALHQQKEKKIEDNDTKAFAQELFLKLNTTHPDEPNVHIIGGDLYLILDKTQEALREYLKAVQLGSTSFEAWQNLLFLESQLNQFDSLIFYSEQGLELFPNQSLLHYFNGYGNMRKKNYREATTSLEQAKKLSTSNPGLVSEINSLLGDAYNGIKEYAKSNAAYDEALAFNPNNDFVLNNYSYYLALRRDHLEKAEKMSTQLVKNNPRNSAYLDTHAWVLFMREKYKEARKYIERAIEAGGVSATHFEHYGDILFKLGDIDEAVVQWQKSKSMDRGNELIDKKIANKRLY
ncbi:MAG: tetratricopeptide repeat protein [Bacteroidia bacterium]|nr:tetratricopeptide repeat protein [Bacteroidia bacterium]